MAGCCLMHRAKNDAGARPYVDLLVPKRSSGSIRKPCKGREAREDGGAARLPPVATRSCALALIICSGLQVICSCDDDCILHPVIHRHTQP